ncbi:MAG TPA: class I SAM-dependent methyltransferase [Terriglobales bacterium]|nr:class I SAM-dependent methyltransferase [Terriglobales bacterium]
MASTEMATNPNKALWEKGDFTQIAAFLRESGEELVNSLGAGPGMKVLDLGCGDGTTALPLARTGAEVLGVDISRPMVEAGNRRAREAGLSRLSFREGDACNLAGIADRTFDLTISIFGAMFAPRPADVAKEMVRVTKPGGRVVMGNWIPNDPTFVSQVLRICSGFAPPPPEGFISPMLWGIESHIRDRFGNAGVPATNVTMVPATFYMQSPGTSPERLIELFRDYYGPTMNAYDAARQSGRAGELHRQLVELAKSKNETSQGTRIPATYMRVTVLV